MNRGVIRSYEKRDVRTEEELRMPQPITATELRSNVYRILDEVLETGVVQEVLASS